VRDITLAVFVPGLGAGRPVRARRGYLCPRPASLRCVTARHHPTLVLRTCSSLVTQGCDIPGGTISASNLPSMPPSDLAVGHPPRHLASAEYCRVFLLLFFYMNYKLIQPTVTSESRHSPVSLTVSGHARRVSLALQAPSPAVALTSPNNWCRMGTCVKVPPGTHLWLGTEPARGDCPDSSIHPSRTKWLPTVLTSFS
jgi:hypothetical protein